MSTKRKFWVAGIALSAIGVVLARVVASLFDEPVPKLVLYGLGVVLALAGLGLIMYGIRKGLE